MRRCSVLFTAALAGLSVFLLSMGIATGQSPEHLRIGLSLQPSNALVMIALEQGFFVDEGLSVSVEEYVSGKRAMADGLFAGNVDLVTASDVPIVFNGFDRKDFRVVASIYHVDNQNRIVARRDSAIAAPSDLKGKRIATQKSSAVHFFLHLFLLEHGLTEEDVQLSFMRGAELPEALARGDIDAFSMRQPFVGQAEELLGSNAIVFEAPGIYNQSDQVVVLDAFLQDNPALLRKALRAMARAESFARDDPEAAQRIVAQSLGSHPADIAAIWPEITPRISFEQSLFLRLEDVAQWATNHGLVSGNAVPNFLDFFYVHALEDVKPEVVTVIR